MAGFAKRERQRIIDEYLNETGHNAFVPAEFIDWLSERPDHEIYPVFFSISDEDAARAYRIDRVRNWASGLRVVVSVSDKTRSTVSGIFVREASLPALVSPMAGRKSGGGYHPVDEHSLPELRAQAALALGSWLERYTGVLELSGIDPHPIKEIVAAIGAVDVVEAA